jgi:hypothetical protein
MVPATKFTKVVELLSEFTYQPDSSWVTFVTPAMKRTLVLVRDGNFVRWQCRACGWASPASEIAGIDADPPAEVIEAFENHDCERYFAKAC